MPIGADAWRADGIDLMNLEHWIERIDDRETINGKRQPTWEIPFRQGTPEIWDAPYRAKTITLHMAVGDTDASGAVTHAGGRRAHLRENLDELITLFSKRGAPIALERDVPNYPGAGTSTRTANVTVIRETRIRDLNTQLRRLSVSLYFPWPFWVGGPVTIPAMSPVTVQVDGDAPTWPTLHFHEAGTVTLAGSAHAVTAPAGTTVDCRRKLVTPSPAGFNAATPDWMMLNPGVNDLDGPRFDVTVEPQWL